MSHSSPYLYFMTLHMHHILIWMTKEITWYLICYTWSDHSVFKSISGLNLYTMAFIWWSDAMLRKKLNRIHKKSFGTCYIWRPLTFKILGFLENCDSKDIVETCGIVSLIWLLGQIGYSFFSVDIIFEPSNIRSEGLKSCDWGTKSGDYSNPSYYLIIFFCHG